MSKLVREKRVNDAMALSTLDAPQPSAEAMTLMRDYIDGKIEVADMLKQTLERYKVNA
ncbi:hypothetical protein AGMMS49975_26610 [Clostridia bacterium]|nr:hypothetical protein AGMMS49975_26610 [Clostridia bacterium]